MQCCQSLASIPPRSPYPLKLQNRQRASFLFIQDFVGVYITKLRHPSTRPEPTPEVFMSMKSKVVRFDGLDADDSAPLEGAPGGGGLGHTLETDSTDEDQGTLRYDPNARFRCTLS